MHHTLYHWIHSFLSDRAQAVRVSNETSSPTITNTGAPQGCVLSPFLYTLYTNDCTSPLPIAIYYKYSYDTAILGLLKDNKVIWHPPLCFLHTAPIWSQMIQICCLKASTVQEELCPLCYQCP